MNVVAIGYFSSVGLMLVSIYVSYFFNVYIGIILMSLAMIQLNVVCTLKDEQSRLKILRM
jgi:hypothetical protein